MTNFLTINSLNPSFYCVNAITGVISFFTEKFNFLLNQELTYFTRHGTLIKNKC